MSPDPQSGMIWGLCMMKDWIFQMEKSPIYWDLSHIFRCHFHQHHHLFWKQSFLPWSARRLLLARRLLRYEDMTSVHISLNIAHSGCKPGRLRESVWMLTWNCLVCSEWAMFRDMWTDISKNFWYGGGSPHKQAVAILLSFIHDMIYQYYVYYVWKEIQVFLGGYGPCDPLDLPLTRSTVELLLLIIERYNCISI